MDDYCDDSEGGEGRQPMPNVNLMSLSVPDLSVCLRQQQEPFLCVRVCSPPQRLRLSLDELISLTYPHLLLLMPPKGFTAQPRRRADPPDLL